MTFEVIIEIDLVVLTVQISSAERLPYLLPSSHSLYLAHFREAVLSTFLLSRQLNEHLGYYFIESFGAISVTRMSRNHVRNLFIDFADFRLAFQILPVDEGLSHVHACLICFLKPP